MTSPSKTSESSWPPLELFALSTNLSFTLEAFEIYLVWHWNGSINSQRYKRGNGEYIEKILLSGRLLVGHVEVSSALRYEPSAQASLLSSDDDKGIKKRRGDEVLTKRSSSAAAANRRIISGKGARCRLEFVLIAVERQAILRNVWGDVGEKKCIAIDPVRRKHKKICPGKNRPAQRLVLTVPVPPGAKSMPGDPPWPSDVPVKVYRKMDGFNNSGVSLVYSDHLGLERLHSIAQIAYGADGDDPRELNRVARNLVEECEMLAASCN
ncbi:hypothetical protein THAOC_34329 [Thalassiosira oceanica]|uniref:Uncharacterized protein n=1 Tax=Thalassiosira oceanica TaxID=159749 RepID=K0RD08_THAOC|nr:hypothetical protein THAOC_34329 [Thalassiosira oceanica]|eukprot:EJK46981.1 hypothetical protein THAOC_34329 [Thalassiosira oceanica]